MSPPAGRPFSGSQRLTRRLLFWGLVCVAGSLVGVGLVSYAQQHPYFAATDILVSTDGRLTPDELRQWAGVRPGMNILTLDVQAVEQRLRQHPWVSTAAVTREFPQRLSLTVRERRPIARIRRPEAAYLDEHGASFVALASDAPDLPYVSGLERVSLDSPTVRTVLAGVHSCLALIQDWPLSLSEIHWDDRRGYTLFLSDRQIVIRLGQQLRPNVFMLMQRVLERWPHDRPAIVFDARFTNQIVASPLPLKLDKGQTDERNSHA